MLGTFKVGRGPFGLASDGANIWVTNYFGKSMTQLRASDGVTLGTYSVGNGAAGMAFDGDSLWVVNNGDNTIMKLSPANGAVISTYATGTGPSRWFLTATKSGCPTLAAILFRPPR